MSKEKAVGFLNRLKNDRQLAGEIKNREEPADGKDIYRVCSEIAAECGEDIPPEDFRAVLADWEEGLRLRTESAACGITSMDDDDLEDVAGGGSRYKLKGVWHDGCYITQDGWCAVSDACVMYNKMYLCDGNWSDTNCDFTFYCEKSFDKYSNVNNKGDGRSDIGAEAVSTDFKEGRVTGADFF